MSAVMSPPTGRVLFNSNHARDALRKRYAAPEWALMEEVAPRTGGGTRYADAIAVNLWSSRGHAIHGFEIKVARSDWLRELKDPSKADELAGFCDHWWIVAPKGIVKDGELPPTWGLLELRESGLVQQVVAPKIEARPVTRAFFASLMRRGHEQLEQLAGRMVHTAIQEARAETDRRVREEVDRKTKDYDEINRQIGEFKEKTGFEFNRYSGPPIEVINLAKRLQSLSGYKSAGGLERLTDLAGQLEKAAETVRQAVNECGLAPQRKDGEHG